MTKFDSLQATTTKKTANPSYEERTEAEMNEFGDQNGMVYVVEGLTEIQVRDTDILWVARDWRASYGAYYRKDRFTLSLPFHMKLNMI